MTKVYVKYENFRDYCDIGDEDGENYCLKVDLSAINEYIKYFKGISKYGTIINEFDITFVDKIKDDNVYCFWNVYLVFEFPDEETALYFTIKYSTVRG